jgi:hypothetical protein
LVLVVFSPEPCRIKLEEPGDLGEPVSLLRTFQAAADTPAAAAPSPVAPEARGKNAEDSFPATLFTEPATVFMDDDQSTLFMVVDTLLREEDRVAEMLLVFTDDKAADTFVPSFFMDGLIQLASSRPSCRRISNSVLCSFLARSRRMCSSVGGYACESVVSILLTTGRVKVVNHHL